MTAGPPRKAPFPVLDTLHLRHQGLTESVCRAFAEAASVCLSRHHVPPADFQVRSPDSQSLRELNWANPSEQALRAWKNADDATRDGAYAVCLASIEVELSLFAVSRAETRTGADYYLGTQSTSLEQSYRLEVSGVDRGDDSVVARRLRQKVQQTREGNSNLPAIASVVGFLARYIGVEVVRA